MHGSDALWNAVYNSLNSRPTEVLLEYEVDPNGFQNGRCLLETTVRRGLNGIPIQDERVNINCSFTSGEIDEPVVARISLEFLDYQGNAALHLMANKEHLQWCEYLLERYPEMLFVPDNHGVLPVFEAVYHERVDICNCFLFLQQCDMNFKIPNTKGKLLLFGIIRTGNLALFKTVHDHFGKELLHLREDGGRTVLAEAVAFGSYALVGDLIGIDADLNEDDKGSCTLLVLAVSRNHIQVFEKLLGIDGINTDQEDEKGWTAYVWAKLPPSQVQETSKAIQGD
ncbi:Ankyrin repeat protein [Penicillium sp. IBT 16267x]|nr:Ankyrin repeat protein [Penicillium sp. IBT 16267x]